MHHVSRLAAGGLVAVAAVLASVGPVQAAGNRLLFDNPHYDVFVPEHISCDAPVTVTVESANPRLFQANSAELQRIVDATQAVLGYQCGDVAGVRLKGRLAGLAKPVYVGVAAAHSGWTLVTTRSIESEKLRAYQPPGAQELPAFTVANLSAGMAVTAARSAIMDTFGVEPEYDAGRGMLSMQSGGCPADYDWTNLSPSPEPGWKCLQARFTGQQPARLYLLHLVQVVGPQDPQRIREYLIEQFGEPVASSTHERVIAWWRPKQTVYTMGWGKRVHATTSADNDAESATYTLQARILPTDDATVVAVTLYVPELQQRSVSASQSQTPELKL